VGNAVGNFVVGLAVGDFVVGLVVVGAVGIGVGERVEGDSETGEEKDDRANMENNTTKRCE
jgi:hypothetical protein